MSSRQDQGYVVGLFVGADPVGNGAGHDFADPRQGLVAMLPNQINQPLLAEFTEIIFRFGHAVTVGHEKLSLAQRDRRLRIGSMRKQSDHGAALLQPSLPRMMGGR